MRDQSCEEKYYGRGLCKPHYMGQYVYGIEPGTREIGVGCATYGMTGTPEYVSWTAIPGYSRSAHDRRADNRKCS